MELWVFDSCGAYSSGSFNFNIHDKPEIFIQALVGYALMSDEELGLDLYIDCRVEKESINVTEDINGKEMKIELEPSPICVQRAVVFRVTTCFSSMDGMRVVNLSWPSDLRPPESEHLLLAP